MNIKQFKKRWLMSKIEPELFYMPVGKRGKLLRIIAYSGYFHYCHSSNYDNIYHGYVKQLISLIDQCNIPWNNSGSITTLDGEDIGYGNSNSIDTNYSIYNSINTHKANIEYYGLQYTFTQQRPSSVRYCHDNTLWGNVNTANPNCTFGVNDGTGTRNIHFGLLELYPELKIKENLNYTEGQLKWFICYDCVAQCFKSQLTINETTTTKYIYDF